MTKKELGTEVLMEMGISTANIGNVVEYVECFGVGQLQARTIVARALSDINLNDLRYWNSILGKVHAYIMDKILDKFKINLYDDYYIDDWGVIRCNNEKDKNCVELNKIIKKYTIAII